VFDEPLAAEAFSAWRDDPSDGNFVSLADQCSELFGLYLARARFPRFYRSSAEWRQEMLILLAKLLPLYQPKRGTLFGFLRTCFRRYFIDQHRAFRSASRQIAFSTDSLDSLAGFHLAHIPRPQCALRSYTPHPYWYR
jgi:hypothetical protein